jgi:hypothetical protein
MTAVERKYALTKIGEGDWLLPSNNAEIIWRIHRPRLTGQTHAWQLHTIPVLSFQRILDRNWEDPREWAHWDYDSGGYRTRREAIDAAMGAEAP